MYLKTTYSLLQQFYVTDLLPWQFFRKPLDSKIMIQGNS